VLLPRDEGVATQERPGRCASPPTSSPASTPPWSMVWACSHSPSAVARHPTSATPWSWAHSVPRRPTCSSPAQRATPARPTSRSPTPPRPTMLPLIYGSGRDNTSKLCLSGILDPVTRWIKKKLRAIRDGERIQRFARREEVTL
jgi:hypothetical protein